MDAVTGCTVHSMLGSGVAYMTIDLNVKMLKLLPKELSLFAEEKIANLSKPLGVSEGLLKDESGKLYAHSTTTCMVLRN